MLNKEPPFGENTYAGIQRIPKYDLDIMQVCLVYVKSCLVTIVSFLPQLAVHPKVLYAFILSCKA